MSLIALGAVAVILSALVAAAFAGIHDARRQRQHAAVLAGALGTIAGICYQYRVERATRIDGVTDDPVWPPDFELLTSLMPAPDLTALRGDLQELARTGHGFFRRVVTLEIPARLLEISGHRAVAARGGPSLDLVWVTDITEREAAARGSAADRLQARHRTRPHPRARFYQLKRSVMLAAASRRGLDLT